MLDFVWEGLLAWLQTIIISGLDIINVDMLYAFSPQMITITKYFPFFEETWELITQIAFAGVVFLALFKVIQNSFLVFTKNYEHPLIIGIRSILALAVITFAPYLVNYFIEFADIAYWGILEVSGIPATDGWFSGINNMLGNMLTTTGGAITNTVTEPIDFASFSPISMGEHLVETLLALLLTIAIAWNYFKLVLAMAERYVVLGAMYYTMPLAGIPIVSRETSSITKSWVKMLIAELMILVLNLWFIAAFRKGVIGSGATVSFTVNGKAVGSPLLWSFIALALLKVAQRIDAHLSTLGLSTPQLAGGVASTLLAGFATTGHMLSNFARKGGVFSPGKNSTLSPFEQRAAASLAKSGRSGTTVTSAKDINTIKSAADAMRAVKDNNVKMSGDAAAAYAKKIAPEQFKGKEILSANADKDGFIAKYKDANGKEATLQFSESKPDGISKQVSIGGTEGFLKDTGTPYSFADVNDNKTKFSDFADQHLNGEDNFIANSGHISQRDLEGATISATPDGEGLVIQDKDGKELARMSAFNDENIEGINANTVIGEGSDGLYRADFNADPNIPLPKGYSYAGEKFVDKEGNEIPHGTEGGIWQDSYETPDNKFISKDEMNGVLQDSYVKNSDYAGNVNYSNDKGFTDADGNQVDMSKCGWEMSTIASEQPLYDVDGTGTSYQTGEEIASNVGLKYSNGAFYTGYGRTVKSDDLGWQQSDTAGANGEALYQNMSDPGNYRSGSDIASDYSELSYQDGKFVSPSGEGISPEALGIRAAEGDIPKVVDDGNGKPTYEYHNSITGGYANGSEIADKLSNPEYAGQTFGGHAMDGADDLYFDGTKAAVFNQGELAEQNAPKYGEVPSGQESYYNPSTGEFGAAGRGAQTFGESVEQLMDNDYAFSGSVGGAVAKAYMQMDNTDVLKATMDKDNIVLEIRDSKLPDDMVRKEQYWSDLGDDKRSGTYQRVSSAGDKSWVKTYDNAARKDFKGDSESDVSTRDHKYGSESRTGKGRRKRH